MKKMHDISEITNTILCGDALSELKKIPDECVDMCCTSPPYWNLRDYGVDGQIGMEETPEIFIQKLVEIFHEVKRVLKKHGNLWVNIGDSYYGSGQDSGKKIGENRGGNFGVAKRKVGIYANIKPRFFHSFSFYCRF